MPSADSLAGSIAAFSERLADIVEHVGLSVVAVQARRRYPSSGLLWHDAKPTWPPCCRIGARVELTLLRGGELQRFEATLEARPHVR